MRKYELMYIIRPDLEDEAVEGVAEKIKGVITGEGGEIVEHEILGKRRLAYEIQKYRDGIYVLVQFKQNPAGIRTERVIRITDDIIRHSVIQDQAS